MATHSNILAWRIPWTEESGGLQSIGLKRVRHDWATFTFFQFTHELSPLTPHWRCSQLFPTLQWTCDTKNKVEILCIYMTQFSSVAQSSVVSLSITNSQSLLKLMSIEWVISYSVIPFSSCLQSFPASGVFQWVSSSHQVAKVLELQFQHLSFQWIFKTDFL